MPSVANSLVRHAATPGNAWTVQDVDRKRFLKWKRRMKRSCAGFVAICLPERGLSAVEPVARIWSTPCAKRFGSVQLATALMPFRFLWLRGAILIC